MYGEYSNNVDTESEITVIASTHASQAELPESAVFSPRSEATVKEEDVDEKSNDDVKEQAAEEEQQPGKNALPESIVISIEEAPKTENSDDLENQEIPALIVQEPTPAPSVVDGSVATND